MMTADEVQSFIRGATVRAIDPETEQMVATVSYLPDGTCQMARRGATAVEPGLYGFSDGLYWTRYAEFRDGTTNSFYLVEVGPGLAQAYFADGRRAFLLERQNGADRPA